MEKNLNTFSREGNQLTHTRLLEAPRDLVWEVWTNPDHIKEWFGPTGFSVTNDEMEVKSGGTWKFTMHGMGKDFPNMIRYKEVKKPSLLRYYHGADGNENDKYGFEVVITFEERGNKTLLTMKSVFKSAEVVDELNKAVNAIEGGKQTLNRLEGYLTAQLKK